MSEMEPQLQMSITQSQPQMSEPQHEPQMSVMQAQPQMSERQSEPQMSETQPESFKAKTPSKASAPTPMRVEYNVDTSDEELADELAILERIKTRGLMTTENIQSVIKRPETPSIPVKIDLDRVGPDSCPLTVTAPPLKEDADSKSRTMKMLKKMAERGILVTPVYEDEEQASIAQISQSSAAKSLNSAAPKPSSVTDSRSRTYKRSAAAAANSATFKKPSATAMKSAISKARAAISSNSATSHPPASRRKRQEGRVLHGHVQQRQKPIVNSPSIDLKQDPSESPSVSSPHIVPLKRRLVEARKMCSANSVPIKHDSPAIVSALLAHRSPLNKSTLPSSRNLPPKISIPPKKASGNLSRVNRFTCTTCDQGFLSRSAFSMHMSLHSSRGNSPYRCNLCNKTYADQQTLAGHKQTIHREGEMALPVVDLEQPCVAGRLASLGIRHFLMLSQLQSHSDGRFGLPIVMIDSSNNVAKTNCGTLGTTTILPIGPLQSVSYEPI